MTAAAARRAPLHQLRVVRIARLIDPKPVIEVVAQAEVQTSGDRSRASRPGSTTRTDSAECSLPPIRRCSVTGEIGPLMSLSGA